MAPRQVAYAMTLAYQKQNLWNEIKNLMPIIERFEESENGSIRRYECELYYMQAIADMVLLNYFEARAGFNGYSSIILIHISKKIHAIGMLWRKCF